MMEQYRVPEWLILIGALGVVWFLLKRAHATGNTDTAATVKAPNDPYAAFQRSGIIEAAANDPTYFLYYNMPQTGVATVDVPAGKTQLFQQLNSGDTTFISNAGTLMNTLAPTFPNFLSNAAGALPPTG